MNETIRNFFREFNVQLHFGFEWQAYRPLTKPSNMPIKIKLFQSIISFLVSSLNCIFVAIKLSSASVELAT